MTEPAASERYPCPRCGESAERIALAARAYRCGACNLELAHVEVAPNGTVRTVIGWLRLSGETLQDRYQITGVLGRGGFAVTYLVGDLRLKGKRRALKEIPLIFYDEAETELLTRLQHPAVPDIVDRFEQDPMMYLVLEFGGHRNLESERRRRNGTIPVAEVLPWMRQLCDVLSYLHDQKPPIIHRDLKPENILLDEHDRIMLIDFGIAKESGEFAVTRTIARSASHGFSPPEQVLGTGTDQRSDVYALGATMYALLTGQAPPPAHERVAGRELSMPRTLAPTIPEPLQAAIVQALSLNINHRQQSIRELGRMCEPEAAMAPMQAHDRRSTVPTERVTATPERTGIAPVLTAARAAGTAPAASARRMGYLLAPLLVVAVGAGWLMLGGRRPATSPSAVQQPGAPRTDVPRVEEKAAPAAARSSESGERTQTASEAYEEELRRRRESGGGVASADTATPTPPEVRPAPGMLDRVRDALRAQGLSGVTVEAPGPGRLRLGNLQTEAEAQRATEIATAVVDPGTIIEASPVTRARVAAPDRRRSAPPAALPSGAPDWGPIRREGASRTD